MLGVSDAFGHLGTPTVSIYIYILYIYMYDYMDVSKNRGTPKSSHFNRVSRYKPSILGYHRIPIVSILYPLVCGILSHTLNQSIDSLKYDLLKCLSR